MSVTLTIEADNAACLHAEMLALLGAKVDVTKRVGESGFKTQSPTTGIVVTETPADAAVPAQEQPTAEVVPIAERKKPGRPKKADTVIESEPAKNPEPTVEDARAVLKDIQTKIGNEEARQLNKKHGEEPLSEKKPAQWAAIIAEGKTLLAALDAE